VTKYLVGLPLAAFALFWFFIVELINLTAVTTGDSFYFDLAVVLLFFLFVGLAFSYILFESIAGSKDKAKIVLASAIIGCAIISFWFRYDLIFLADKAFFWKNQAELEDNATSDIAVVKQMSSHNFHKLFLYVRLHLIEDGKLSLETKDALGEPLEAFRGCTIVAKSLSKHFFLLSIDCG
jgi:hypothetical protein